MYPDEKFHEDDPEEIRAFVEQYPLATLVGTDASGDFVATHVPLLVERWNETVVLRGHIMRETDHWHALKHSPRAFVAFTGPDAPVLASWQLTPRFGGTWNYQAVHVRGAIRWQDSNTLLSHLEILKNRFETSADHQFAQLPEGYVSTLAPMIECFDVVVSDLKCIFKLSQNRELAEFDRTVAALLSLGGEARLVAEEMQARRAKYYGGER